jgi:hypothetical protein
MMEYGACFVQQTSVLYHSLAVELVLEWTIELSRRARNTSNRSVGKKGPNPDRVPGGSGELRGLREAHTWSAAGEEQIEGREDRRTCSEDRGARTTSRGVSRRMYARLNSPNNQLSTRLLPCVSNLALHVVDYHKEQIREAVDELAGVGVVLGAAYGDLAVLHPAHR